MVSPAGLIASFLLLAVACGKDGPTEPPATKEATLRFKVEPVDVMAGAPLSQAIQVEVLDATGSPVTKSSAEVTLALISGPSGAVLLGTLTAKAKGGVATFDGLRLEHAGSGYRLKVSAPGLSTIESKEFTVHPAEAARLAFTAVPAKAEGQVALAPAVEVEVQDRFGNRAVGWTGKVDLGLAYNPGADTLAGTLTVTVVNSVARFTDLSLATPGKGYRLRAVADGLSAAESAPFDVRLTFAAVTAGHTHTCGVTTAGKAYCWGYGELGQLGNGDTTSSAVPVAVASSLLFGTAVHGCGVTTEGQAYCWGSGDSGRLGNGGTANSLIPVPVSGNLTFATVSVGSFHSCGVTTEGQAYCWGSGYYGSLGTGGTTDSTVPVAVSTSLTFASVTAGGGHSCGVTTAGKAYCWGANWSGQLGDDSRANSSVPVLVWGGLTFASVTTGSEHTCGVTTSEEAYCWGYSAGGRLGTGDTVYRWVPTRIFGTDR
jgi:hypothetical protein